MCSIGINFKLYTCTYLYIELLDVFVFILKNKMAYLLYKILRKNFPSFMFLVWQRWHQRLECIAFGGQGN